MKEHQIGHQLTKQFNVEFPLEIVENEDGKQVKIQFKGSKWSLETKFSIVAFLNILK